MKLRRVVITGLGAITPIGNDIQSYWEGLRAGRSGTGQITRFNPEKFKCKIAAEVKGYDPLAYFDKKEVKRIDTFTQYALVTVAEALKDSALDTAKIDSDRAGVVFSSGIGGLGMMEEEYSQYYK